MADYNIEASFLLQTQTTLGLKTVNNDPSETVFFVSDSSGFSGNLQTSFSNQYEKGTIIEVLAPAKYRGLSFAHWIVEKNGSVVKQSSDPLLVFEVDDNIIVKGYYDKQSFLLTCSAIPGILSDISNSNSLIKVSIINGITNDINNSEFGLKVSINII